jgi:hypothetical protein
MDQKIELHEAGAHRLWPECLKMLASVPACATYHVEWGLRQPLGTYNVSLEALPRRFNAVLDSLETLRRFPERIGPELPGATTRLLDAHRALLYAMMEHVEDCDNIAKSFFPKDRAAGKEKPLKDFRAAVRPFRDPLGKIVNAMKHRQGRLGLCEAHNSMARIFGYCVQTAIGPDVIGPDEEIHGSTGPGKLAAISFNHDLRWQYLTVFAVGRQLATFVEEVIGENREGSQDAGERGAWVASFEVAKRIGSLPGFVYPHEARGAVPFVAIREQAGVGGSDAQSGQRMILTGRSNGVRHLTLGQIPGGPFTISFNYHGDGVTRSFKVP